MLYLYKNKPEGGFNMVNRKNTTNTSFKSKIEVNNIDPEVKSYIYQSLMEFEPFITPDTTIAVIAKDPLRLISQFEAEDVGYNRDELKVLKRISIFLVEDGNKLEEEGLHANIFQAINIAKEKLLKKLNEIQDAVISAQERTVQINSIRQSGSIH